MTTSLIVWFFMAQGHKIIMTVQPSTYINGALPQKRKNPSRLLGACANGITGLSRCGEQDHRRIHRPVAAVPGIAHFAPSVAPPARWASKASSTCLSALVTDRAMEA